MAISASLMAQIPAFTLPSMSPPQRTGEAQQDQGSSWKPGRPGPDPLELPGMFPSSGKCQGPFLSLRLVPSPKVFLLLMPAL